MDLPEVGDTLGGQDTFGEVESTKSVSDLFAPVPGAVVEVNTELDDRPELVNADPYGEGWIIVVEPSDPAAVDALLDAAGYRALLDG